MQEEFTREKRLEEMFLEFEERKAVKKTAMMVGFAYLLLLFIPRLCVYLFAWSSSVLRFNIAQVLAEPIFENIWQIAVSMLMMLLPAIILIKLEKKPISEVISFKKPRKKLFLPFIFIGAGVCAFANIATNVIALFLESYGIYYSSPEIAKPEGLIGTMLIILSTAVTPALVEEFLMRGAVLGSVKRYGEDVAVIISAVLFGLMHTNGLQIPFAFMVGLILALAVIKSGSLWTGIAIHFVNNFMSALLGNLLTFGGSDTLRGTATAIYFALSFALFFVGILMLKGREKEALRLDSGEFTATSAQKLGWFFSSPAILAGIVISVLMTIGIV